MNIYVIRHGATEQNTMNNYYGALDVSLNHKGRIQCKVIGEIIRNVKFHSIFVSDKKRTIQTVENALKVNKEKSDVVIYTETSGDINRFKVDERLNERNFGIFEGYGHEELKELFPQEYINWENDWIGYCPQDGESHRDVCERVFSFMDDLLRLKEDNILICTHAGVIRAMYCYLMDKNMECFWKFGCNNGDMIMFKYEYGNLYLDSIIPCGKKSFMKKILGDVEDKH